MERKPQKYADRKCLFAFDDGSLGSRVLIGVTLANGRVNY